MYFASLKAEKGEGIVFHIVYLDPKKQPDPRPPRRIVRDRWQCTPLEQRIRLEPDEAVKLAKASDPRTSSLAVFHDARGAFIWGLVDQGNRYHDFVTYNSESGPERPGIFQAAIAGPGNIIVYLGYEKLAELEINSLKPRALDVLRDGPVNEALEPGMSAHVRAVQLSVPDLVWRDRAHWEDSTVENWISALCRLLLRIENYHHGGAVLVTPDDSFAGLNIKYELHYDRLRSAMERRAVSLVDQTYAQDEIFNLIDDPDRSEIPIALHLEEAIASDDLEDSRSEIDGTTWFVSLLSRVDGLVLMTPTLEVRGFGVEIRVEKDPPIVFRSVTVRAPESRLRKMDPTHFGMRHRSMMRIARQSLAALAS